MSRIDGSIKLTHPTGLKKVIYMDSEIKVNKFSRKKAALWVTIIAAIVFVFDIITKIWAYTQLRGQYPIDVIPNFFRFAYAENTGIAFSLFHDQGFLISIITPVAFIILLILVWQQFAANDLDFLYVLFFGLIIGGALGNILNRLYSGYVVDFIDVYIGNKHWPTFNIADSALTVGQVILVWKLFFGYHSKEEKPPEENTLSESKKASKLETNSQSNIENS